MVTISVRIDDALEARLKAQVECDGTSKTKVVTEALEQYFDDEDRQYQAIPDNIRNRIKFLEQIILCGKREKDWEFVKDEVVELWKILINSEYVNS